jgi:hypothetical protein
MIRMRRGFDEEVSAPYATPDYSLIGGGMPNERKIEEGHGRRTVTLLLRDEYVLDGSAPNLSIATSIKIFEALKCLPRGPHVAYKDLSNGLIGDITLTDFRLAIRYLLQYTTGPHQNPHFKLQRPPFVYPDTLPIQILDFMIPPRPLFVQAPLPADETTEQPLSRD